MSLKSKPKRSAPPRVSHRPGMRRLKAEALEQRVLLAGDVSGTDTLVDDSGLADFLASQSPAEARFVEDRIRSSFSREAAANEGAPQVAISFFGVFEFSEQGSLVGTISASDPEGGELTYALAGSGNEDGDGDGEPPFTIDPLSGNIYANDSDELDMELVSPPLFVLQAEATDPDGLTGSAPQIIELLPARPGITIDSVEAEEGSDLVFTVTLDRSADGPFDVALDIDDQSASGGSDYTASVTSLSFDGDAGETQQFTVTTMDDDVVEFTETFSVQLDASNPFVIEGSSGLGTITDNDTATISIDDVTAVEGEPLLFTLSLDTAVRSAFEVTVSFTDDTATGGSLTSGGGSDYDNTEQTVLFSGEAGETHQVSVATVGDNEPEDDEKFTVSLTTAESLVDVSDTGTGTITNNSPPVISDLTISVEENQQVGALIGTISATDPEGRSLTYRLTQNANPNDGPVGAVRVDSATGDIFVVDSSDFDFESANQLMLEVEATENGAGPPGLSASAAVEILITDANDAPVIDPIGNIVTGGDSIELEILGNDPDAGQDFADDSRFEIVSFDTDGLTPLQQRVFDARLQIEDGNDYFNLFGGQEKWLQSTVTGDWHFVLPTGQIFLWSGTFGFLGGESLGVLDASAYDDPTLITANRLAGPLANPQNIPIPPGSATGIFSGNVLTITSSDFFGVVDVTVRATDMNGSGLSDEESFRVEFTRLNQLPVFDPIEDQVSIGGSMDIVVPLSATDPDGDTNLRYSAEILGPVPAVVSIEDGTLTITRRGRFFGSFDVLVSVWDSQGGRTDQIFRARFAPPTAARPAATGTQRVPVEDRLDLERLGDRIWQNPEFFADLADSNRASGATDAGLAEERVVDQLTELLETISEGLG